MRISELRQREAFDSVLCETLSRGWTEQYGHDVSVSVTGTSGQVWRAQPLLSAVFTSDLHERGRQFLRDFFRHTRTRSRIVPQWIAGTTMTTAVGLRASSRAFLRVTPPLVDAGNLVIIPGNHRVRVFDFGHGTVRTLLKPGRDRQRIATEVQIRGQRTDGPFLPVHRWSSDHLWMEEDIWDGYALPRCPPWWDQDQLATMALTRLTDWQAESRSQTDGRVHAAELVERIERRMAELLVRHPVLLSLWSWDWLRVLQSVAGGVLTINVAQSHGDFQPGNILVSRDGQDVVLTDWEYSTVRWIDYDRTVHRLHSRTSPGVSGRLRAMLAQWRVEARDADARMAIFLLEDLDWYLIDSGSADSVPVGLTAVLKELGTLGESLAGLFEARP